ncbi:MAG: hypothetical protein G01um101472_415 [Parcubacteria group bacterium Gr01-1014_72]|nr:MAG: hypothetical protein G01um101472_415 [Parcubacteria group bacterium Gr01-1014_72]
MKPYRTAFFLSDFWYDNHMTTVTIPKEFAKDAQLIAVPRFVYEEYVTVQRKIKSMKTFRMTVADKRKLTRARTNFKKGNFVYLKDL